VSSLKLQYIEPGVMRMSLASGGGNPLTPELLDELESALDDMEADPPRAFVLDGGDGKLFSGGFDVPRIAPYGREEVKSFFSGFTRSVLRIITLPCPTLVAIHSAAIAGGFILCNAFDLRIVGSDPRIKMGLSEVMLGIAVPAGTQQIVSERTSQQFARRIAMTAQLFGPETALASGFADELADDPQARAVEAAIQLASLPGEAVAVTKMFRAEGIAARMRAEDEAHMDEFLNSWMSPAGQAGLRALVAKLTKPKT
jgi:enoyl-CoA hydratase/carnithine racemase